MVDRKENCGGGDCLFYAVLGKDMDRDEIRDARYEVGAYIEGKKDDEDQMKVNAETIPLILMQSENLREKKIKVDGKESVSNKIFGCLIKVPRTYVGTEVIKTWCGKEGKCVIVLDDTVRKINIYFPKNRTEEIEKNFTKFMKGGKNSGVIVILLESENHWVRVERIKNWLGEEIKGNYNKRGVVEV